VNTTAAHFVFMNGIGEVKYETFLRPRSKDGALVQEMVFPDKKEDHGDLDSGFIEQTQWQFVHV
jgi:hypothetical protein